MLNSGEVSHHPFKSESDHFVDCILNNKESRASIEDAVKTHEIVFVLDELADQGGKVMKLPLL